MVVPQMFLLTAFLYNSAEVNIEIYPNILQDNICSIMLTFNLLLFLIERFVHKVSIVHAREDSRINFLLNILIKKNPDIGSGKKGGGNQRH